MFPRLKRLKSWSHYLCLLQCPPLLPLCLSPPLHCRWRSRRHEEVCLGLLLKDKRAPECFRSSHSASSQCVLQCRATTFSIEHVRILILGRTCGRHAGKLMGAGPGRLLRVTPQVCFLRQGLVATLASAFKRDSNGPLELWRTLPRMQFFLLWEKTYHAHLGQHISIIQSFGAAFRTSLKPQWGRVCYCDSGRNPKCAWRSYILASWYH